MRLLLSVLCPQCSRFCLVQVAPVPRIPTGLSARLFILRNGAPAWDVRALRGLLVCHLNFRPSRFSFSFSRSVNFCPSPFTACESPKISDLSLASFFASCAVLARKMCPMRDTPSSCGRLIPAGHCPEFRPTRFRSRAGNKDHYSFEHLARAKEILK